MNHVDSWTLVFFFFAIGLVVLSGVVFSAVRREDPELWQALGAPSLFNVNAQASVYKFWVWIFSKNISSSKLRKTTFLLLSILRVGTLIFLIGFFIQVVRVFAS